MFASLLLLIFFIDVAVGATSYWLVAGSQTDWSQLVTYAHPRSSLPHSLMLSSKQLYYARLI